MSIISVDSKCKTFYAFWTSFSLRCIGFYGNKMISRYSNQSTSHSICNYHFKCTILCIQNQISKSHELKPIPKYTGNCNYVFAFEQRIVVADFENSPHSNLFFWTSEFYVWIIDNLYELTPLDICQNKRNTQISNKFA